MKHVIRNSLVVAALLIQTGCHSRDTTPRRPAGVPESAQWAGGKDGGAFIECLPSKGEEPNRCTVYNDWTGDVWMSGEFVLQAQKRGAEASELRFSGSPDGERVYLQNNLILAPIPGTRPPSVPMTALLTENGVYVDCHPGAKGTYDCALFLAATGVRFHSGVYRCDETLPACTDPHPKMASRSDINLQNAGLLKAIK